MNNQQNNQRPLKKTRTTVFMWRTRLMVVGFSVLAMGDVTAFAEVPISATNLINEPPVRNRIPQANATPSDGMVGTPTPSGGGGGGGGGGEPTDPNDSELVITLSDDLQKECPGGYIVETYSPEGVHSSLPGQALTVPVKATWHGWAGIIARCGRRIWKDWSRFKGRTARDAGVASVTLDGFELSSPHTLVCDDPWGVGIKPLIPLDVPNFGRCPP